VSWQAALPAGIRRGRRGPKQRVSKEQEEEKLFIVKNKKFLTKYYFPGPLGLSILYSSAKTLVLVLRGRIHTKRINLSNLQPFRIRREVL
jgi:hypothetical protein